jgi:hypothetical protein
LTGNDRDLPPSGISYDLLTIGRIIGDTETCLPPALLAPVRTLIYHLSKDVTPKPPPPERDLEDPSHITQLIGVSNVLVKLSQHENGRCYLLQGKAAQVDNPPWKIMVFDAATALQCLRANWGPDDENIARNLCRRGIPFCTLTPIPTYWLLKAPSQQPSVGLGWRELGYKPDPVDYKAYEFKRDAFLRSPHGRAAILTGGIVWRLAIDVLGIDDVLRGPSEDSYQFGVRHNATGLVPSCDDILSEDELDLICGVYKVYTSKPCSHSLV